MFFTAFVVYFEDFEIKLKTEGQTTKTENLTVMSKVTELKSKFALILG